MSNEITYLENFIELEKLRQNNNVEVTLQLDQPYSKHLGIAPFILMTFVENAFKHVSKDANKSNWINIQLGLDGQLLDLSISNSTSLCIQNEVIHYGGIGLKNVQRRLDLLYPDQYDLDIQNNAGRFGVRLRLRLSELVIPQPMMQKTA